MCDRNVINLWLEFQIVEFGPAELNFIRYMKNVEGVEEIICVDIDRETLNTHKAKAEPLYSEYLHERSCPLTVSVYEGSATDSDPVLKNADAVIAIEMYVIWVFFHYLKS